MNVIRSLRDKGFCLTEERQRFDVEYNLQFTQDKARIGSGRAPMPGLMNIVGRVWCPADAFFPCLGIGRTLVLELRDGRKLKFFFRNGDGEIAVEEWLD